MRRPTRWRSSPRRPHRTFRPAALRELRHHFGHQALHLLSLVEDLTEQDQRRPDLCHLAQTSHAGVGWSVDRERLQLAQLEERVEAVQRLADSPLDQSVLGRTWSGVAARTLHSGSALFDPDACIETRVLTVEAVIRRISAGALENGVSGRRGRAMGPSPLTRPPTAISYGERSRPGVGRAGPGARRAHPRADPACPGEGL